MDIDAHAIRLRIWLLDLYTGGRYIRMQHRTLMDFIENHGIDGPSIPEDELQARGKSVLVIKLIAVLQIIWFVVQTLVRAIQHYQITATETMTVAFVFCSVFMYGFALNQPQDVVYPMILQLRNVAPDTNGRLKNEPLINRIT